MAYQNPHRTIASQTSYMLDSNYQSYTNHATQDSQNLNNSYTNINQNYHNETQNHLYLSNQIITTQTSSLRSMQHFYENEDLNHRISYECTRPNHDSTPTHHSQSYQPTFQPIQYYTQSNQNPMHSNLNNQNINHDINQNLNLNN